MEVELAKSVFEFFSLACVGAFCSSLLQSIIDGAAGSLYPLRELRGILLAECGPKIDCPVTGHGVCLACWMLERREALGDVWPGPEYEV